MGVMSPGGNARNPKARSTRRGVSNPVTHATHMLSDVVQSDFDHSKYMKYNDII